MATEIVNKQRFKEKFRVLDNPRKVVLGLMHEPPEEIRYSNNAVVRMLEVAHDAFNLEGKQIIHTGRSHAIYLMGSFVSLRNDKTYRCYEATHKNQLWSRQKQKIHAVTKLPTSEFVYEELGNINVAVLHNSNAIRVDDNPTQTAMLISTDLIMSADIVGNFLIREVRLEYGLYFAQAEYKTVKPNG